jgi:hypothetical protein
VLGNTGIRVITSIYWVFLASMPYILKKKISAKKDCYIPVLQMRIPKLKK